MKNSLFLFVLPLILLCAACSSTPEKSTNRPNYSYKAPTHSAPRSSQGPTKELNLSFEQELDLNQLQRVLRMDRSSRSLGMTEKRFNSCEASALLPNAQPCRDYFLSILHFQLVCRNSEGTVQELSKSDLSAISSTDVNWSIGAEKGTTATDNEGFAQIRVMTAASTKGRMFMLKLRNEILAVRTQEVRKFVVPQNWCTPDYAQK